MRFLAPASTHRIGARLNELDFARPDDGRRLWVPCAWIRLDLHFDEGTTFASDIECQRLVVPLGAETSEAVPVSFAAQEILHESPPGWFLSLPAEVDEEREAKALQKALVDEIHRGESMTIWKHAALKLVSAPGESNETFLQRVHAAVDADLNTDQAALKRRADDAVDRLQDRITRKQLDLEQARSAARAQQVQEVVNVGETLLGMFLGKRRKSLSSSVTRRRQTMHANARIADIEAQLRELEGEVLDAHDELAARCKELEACGRAMVQDLVEVQVGLEKNDISLRDFCILWIAV